MDEQTREKLISLIKAYGDSCHEASDECAGQAEWEACERAEGELIAALSQKAEAPGWVMVPIEPTQEMRCDGFESSAWDELGSAVLKKKGWPYSCKESAECVSAIYKAMIAAAPKATP